MNLITILNTVYTAAICLSFCIVLCFTSSLLFYCRMTELAFSLLCVRGCWFSTYDYDEMIEHMMSYEHDDNEEGHRTRCGCCNGIFFSTSDLQHHLFNTGTNAYQRHQITIMELIQVTII